MIRDRVRHALPAAWLVHGLRSACALATALPLAASVGQPPAAAENVATGRLVVLSHLFQNALEHPWRFLAGPFVGWVVLSPWALLVLLSATERAAPLEQHARRALRLYLRGLALWAIGSGYAIALLAAAERLSDHARALVESRHDARLETLAAVSIALPCLIALLHPLTALDTANAALLAPGARLSTALRSGLRRATPRRLLVRAGYGLLAFALFAFAGWFPRALLGFTPGAGAFSLIASQLLVLPATLLRTRWLASLHDDPPSSADLDLNAQRFA